MSNILGILVVLGVFIVIAAAIQAGWLTGKGRSDSDRPTLPYSSQEYLLTRGERAFYDTLRLAIDQNYHISMKVRMADLLKTSDNSHRNRIISKHLDFVISDASTTRILCCIELDDKSHQRKDRRDRDAFIDAALQAGGIPLVHFQALSQYSVESIKQRLVEFLPQCKQPSARALR